MAQFNTLSAFAAALRTADPPPPVPHPPTNSATVMDGVKDASSHEEARILLEKRKEIPPPEDLAAREAPTSKKRKRPSSKTKSKTAEPTPDNPVVVEDEEDASSDSVEQIFEAVPLRTNFPGVTIREPEVGISGHSVTRVPPGKGKQVLGEEEHVYAKNIWASKPDVPFVNLGSSKLAARFNKASGCLIHQVDMDFLDSMSPAERLQKAQSAMAEGLIRMLFETSKIQQNEVDQETVRALTARVDEQNDKLARLTVKLEKCKNLSEQLELADQWRTQMKEILGKVVQKLESSSGSALQIATEVSDLLAALDSAAAQSKDLPAFFKEILEKMELLAEVAKYYKLKSERRGRIAKE